jgi:hypothetical protein
MPAGNTYEAIAEQTLGSAAATVTFSSIPSTFTDLVLVCNILGSGGTADSNAALRFNGDTGSNYSRTTLAGDGSSAASFRSSNATRGLLQATGYYSTTPATIISHIQSYSNSTTNKTVISRASLSTWSAEATVNLWRNTSAVTSITLVLATGTFAAGSTFSLYGIKSA